MIRRTFPPNSLKIERPACVAGPVIVSVPHAGRIYPSEILTASRVPVAELERLEDGWSDLIAGQAALAGATIVTALWARAVADCNRAESQMAPTEVTPILRHQFGIPGRKERAGLGVIPTRLSGSGYLWKAPIDRPAFNWRLDRLHRPYHQILAEELAAAKARHGYAILIDLHSMPPIPAGNMGFGAGMVIGDLHGQTADGDLVRLIRAHADKLRTDISYNQPYAGGHIVAQHGKPGRGVHAVQLEIDRALYLQADRTPDADRVAWLAQWFRELIDALSHVDFGGNALPCAAE